MQVVPDFIALRTFLKGNEGVKINTEVNFQYIFG